MYRIVVLGMLSGRNGVSTSMMNLYRNLDKEQFQWDFVVFSKYKKIGNETSSGTFAKEIRSLGGRIHFLSYNTADIPKSSRKKLKEILLSDRDIVGVHVHDIGRNVYPLYLADQLNLPIKVIQFHSGCPKSEAESYLNNIDRKTRARLNMIAGDQFDRLACSDLSGISAYRYLPYEIMPNGVDTRRFSYNEVYRQLLRQQLGIDENTVVFGMLGTVYYIKNPIFALKVFKEYQKINKNSFFAIVGGGFPEIFDEINKFATRNGLRKKIRALGQQLQADMFYSAFDIFMCPSLKEGFPNTLCEAQAAGLPCLVSDEITQSVAITPLVEFGSLHDSPKVWAERIDEMIRKSKPRKSYNNEIKKAGYDIVDVAKKLGDLYLKRIEENRK